MKSRIDTDIAKIYRLVLKYNMKIRDIPFAWINVERAKQRENPSYKVDKLPGYVKVILEYGTDKTKHKGLINGAWT